MAPFVVIVGGVAGPSPARLATSRRFIERAASMLALAEVEAEEALLAADLRAEEEAS